MSYSCNICNTKPDQISHHKTHIESQKHKDKKELFELKLYRFTPEELYKLHKTDNIQEIVNNNENKKLNIKEFDELDIDYNNIMNTMTDNNIISNKDNLKDKIHEIHNYLRNHGGGYGMNALKIFNLLYGLKKIEEKGVFNKCGLSKECKFSYLLELAEKNKDEELTSLILGKVLDSINDSKIKSLLFYEIPRNLKSTVYSYLIKEINSITKIEEKCNVLLSGKIYEYFIGRDATAISELGAYFTDRHIVEYIYSKLGNVMDDNGLPKTMIDMFGGSGGFTTGYINHIIKTNPKFEDWEKGINNIYHYDMNEDVIKSAGLEFFCLTGVIPDMSINLQYKNSFTDEFETDKKDRITYDLVITNPPYGGDKNKQTGTQIKRGKIEEYIKEILKTSQDEKIIKQRKIQLEYIKKEKITEKKKQDKSRVSVDECSQRIRRFAKKHNLTGTDKEACSLMLMMDMLKINGTCIGVLKEGVIVNKEYKNLRECLIKNFNLRAIISVPRDQFENTTTKTTIVIFDNTEIKTSEVSFYDLIVDRYKEDKFEEIGGCIVLTENKGDIKRVYDKLVSVATIDMIMNNEIRSFNMKEYNKKEIVCGEGYELAMLKDICEFMPKSKRSASFGKKDGKYNFYTSSDKVQKCDVVDYEEECIIVGDGGIANIKLDSNFSCSDHNHLFKSKNNQFIFNMLKSNINLLSNGFKGSVLKNLSIKYLQNLQIPVPKSQAKIKEWTTKISIPYDEKIMKTSKIAELEKQVLDEIKRIGEEEECDEVEYNKVGEIMCGKNLTKENAITGSYNVYGGGNTSYTHNEYNLEGFNILVSRVGNNNVSLVDEKLYLTDNGFSLLVKDKKIKKYIGYYIFMNNDNVLKLGNGSAQKVISKTKLNKLKLHIPRDKSLIQKLDPIFQQIEQLQVEVKNADILYNKLIKELADEAIPPSKQTQKPKMKTIEEEIMDTSDISSIDIEKETKKSIKKIKTKMKTIEEEIMDTSDISSIDNEKETKKSIKKIKIKKVSPDSSSDEIKNKIKNKIKN
jgi:type I restriction-modification system DNA methylase subunit